MVLILLPASTAAVEPSLTVDRYTVTPSVLAPGDMGTLAIVLTHGPAGDAANLSSVSAVRLDGNGLEVVTPPYRRFGSLGPGQSVTVTFVVKAPAGDGVYFPDVVVESEGQTVLRYPVPVNVNSRFQVLRAPSIVVEKDVPDAVEPGTAFVANLTLRNGGALRAQDLRMVVNTSSPYLGVQGPMQLAVGDLAGGEERDLRIEFVTDRRLSLGLAQAGLLLTYQLPDGTAERQVEVVEIPVKGRPELSVASFTTDPANPVASAPVRLIIRLENTGTDAARSVAASAGLPMAGTREAFVGQIQPGNDAPVIFTVTPGEAGEYPFNLSVAYTDDYGPHVETRTLHLVVARNDVGWLVPAAIILVLLGAGVYLYRRRRGGT